MLGQISQPNTEQKQCYLLLEFLMISFPPLPYHVLAFLDETRNPFKMIFFYPNGSRYKFKYVFAQKPEKSNSDPD